MADVKKNKVDPLYQLFEQYLLNRSYEDANKFTKEIAADYLAYLNSSQAHVPIHVRKNVVEDLEAEAHEMLLKKMYGIVRADEYQNIGSVLKVDPETGIETHDYIPVGPSKEVPEKE